MYTKKELVQLVDNMPAFPPSVSRILTLTADITCAPKDLIRIIELDPVLTLKLLQLVNSPYFGLSRQISSIKQAVVFVGINTIKNLALTIAPLEILNHDSKDTPHMENMLYHAIAVGVISRHLARRCSLSEIESTDFFVAGLLHDFGKMALYRFLPKKYNKTLHLAAKKQIPLHRAERKTLGVNHLQVGALLAKKWHLPMEFIACMGNHHDWKFSRTSLLQDCIYTANLIAQTIGVGDSGDPILTPSLPKPIERRLNAKLPELIGTLGDLAGEMHKAKVFIYHWHSDLK
ncbi:MAG: HDOD domain-containing protein [Magnetococcales bacterium]|nr:HDOD domain-containing protein [Magnetococcales bacterium]MBF0439755.1 HDOD domain-containing protein [Magnetococcales bacterium]